MPVSKYYRSLSGNVKVPGEEDPVEIGRQGNTTSMDFGLDLANPGTYSQFLGAPNFEDIQQQFRREQPRVQAQPSTPAAPSNELFNELLFGRGMPQMPASLAGKPAKPAESYGTNRGGTGSAGRGQLGKSQFDVQTYAQPEMSIADLRKMDDKPWELDDNTAADVTPGLSFTQKPDENVVDKEPDLQSPRGMYEALAKKYPDILTQNLDQLQKSRVTEDDLESLSDRSGLGSLFIAASKAASGAGSIGGKTAESIAPAIVNREDTLARQRLKDRMDVASENMQMNAKAVDLAIKQINFADEREQYDPNSDVSQFARDFMKQEFDVNVPPNVPAYQLKQFMPAVVQKYQAEERARYQGALLGYKETPEQQAARRATESEAERRFKAEQARLDRQSREGIAEDRLNKPGAGAKVITGTEIPKDVADKEFSIADKFNNEPSVKKFKQGNIALQEMQGLAKEESTYGDQGLISGYAKILDPESVVREGEYAVVERGGGFLDGLANRIAIFKGEARLQPAQRQALIKAAEALQNGRRSEYQRIRKGYEERARGYGLDPVRALGTDDTPAPAAGAKPSGLSPAEKARKEELLRKRGGK